MMVQRLALPRHSKKVAVLIPGLRSLCACGLIQGLHPTQMTHFTRTWPLADLKYLHRLYTLRTSRSQNGFTASAFFLKTELY